MKVIYNGKLVEVDSETIDGKKIITSDNYDEYESKKLKRESNELELQTKRELKIENNKVLDNDGVLWEDRHIISNP